MLIFMIIHGPPVLVSQRCTPIKQITNNQQTCGSSAFYKDWVSIHFPFEPNYFSLPLGNLKETLTIDLIWSVSK